MKQAIIAAIGFLVAAACGSAAAVPIVYSIYGSVDGELNGQSFSEAEFRLELRTDTVHTVTAIENGVTVYRNNQGTALLYLTRGKVTTVAHIAANQLFVRYDPTNGIVSFGTNGIGPYYPVSLGWCTVPLGCGKIGTGFPQNSILGALAQLTVAPNDLVFYPAAVRAQATQLRSAALLTGFMDACLAYNVTRLVCPSIPSTPIRTDQGNLYFQKQSLYGHGIFVAAEGSVL
jgi:hypothetical protein